MPIDFLNMLAQFEQLDNQKEQLLLQRQEQASRNVAQAVGTLVTIAPEARAGYLEQMRQSTGMDYGFLQALAVNTPTPQSILVARGFERAMAAGDISDTSLAANTLGMTPIAFQTQQQVSQYLKDGTVPDMIKKLDPALQPQALFNLVTSSAGLPDTTQLDLQVNPLLDRGQRQTAAQIGADLRPGAKQITAETGENKRNAARVGVQAYGIASGERQDTANRNQRKDEFLATNGRLLATAELGARVDMSQGGAGGRGGRGGSSAASGAIDPITGLSLKDLYDRQQFFYQNGIEAEGARNGVGGMYQTGPDKAYAGGIHLGLLQTNEAIQRVLNPANAPVQNTMQTPTFTPSSGFNMFQQGLGPAGLLQTLGNRP